jgi:hypothetical protein
MRPHAAHPADRAGTAEGAPSRPRRSLAGVRAWPPRCGVLARLLAPCGHRSAPPIPAWQGQRRTNKFLLESSPLKSPTAVHLPARLCPRVHVCAIRARLSASLHPERSRRSWCSPYKRDPLDAIWPHPTTVSLLDSSKPSLLCSTSVSATLSMLSRLTRLPPSCAGLEAHFRLSDAPNRRRPTHASVPVRIECCHR